MYSKRVFSNKKDINFIDYNNKKKYKEIYQNLRSKESVSTSNNLLLTRDNILDYQTFLNLTRKYLKECASYSSTSPCSINDGKTSYICYNQMLSHINDCDYCCKCKNIDKICECTELKNILYPYGNYINKEYPTECVDVSCCSISNKCFDKTNTIYPSQHQFMCYQTDCLINDNYDKIQRMNAFAKYPQINNNTNTNTNNTNNTNNMNTNTCKIVSKCGLYDCLIYPRCNPKYNKTFCNFIKPLKIRDTNTNTNTKSCTRNNPCIKNNCLGNISGCNSCGTNKTTSLFI